MKKITMKIIKVRLAKYCTSCYLAQFQKSLHTPALDPFKDKIFLFQFLVYSSALRASRFLQKNMSIYQKHSIILYKFSGRYTLIPVLLNTSKD